MDEISPDPLSSFRLENYCYNIFIITSHFIGYSFTSSYGMHATSCATQDSNCKSMNLDSYQGLVVQMGKSLDSLNKVRSFNFVDRVTSC